MHRPPVRPAAAALAGAAAAFAGCQSYQPRPLDLAEHREVWAARTAGDEPVRAFARSLAAPGRPATFDPADGVSLAEGEVVALVFNPDLRLARLRAGVAAATAEHAGLWDDPEFSIDVLRVTESVSNPWVISPGLAFTIPLSGRLDAEKQRAEASLRAELARVAEQEWAVRLELRRRWVQWSAARLRAERTAALLESIESLVESTMQLAEAGELQRTEAGLFAIERASQARALVRWRGEAQEAEQRLLALMGLAPGAGAALELVPLLSLEAAPEAISGDELAERNLRLARLREEYAAAEQSLRREIRRQYPDLTIGPLYESDQGQSRIGFLGAIPLPLLNANRQGIAEAEAEREFARAAFETEYERLTGALAAARIRHDTLHEQRRLLETEIVPLVDGQLAAARRLLELGEGGGRGGLVLLESLSRVGESQMELIEATLAESLAAIDLAALAGPPAATPAIELNNHSAAGEPAAPSDEVTP